MRRPIYETERDRDAERLVAQLLEGLWSARLTKTPRLSPVDYHAQLPDGGRWVEIKCRENTKLFYAEYMISKRKIDAGVELERNSGEPFFLVVSWSDRVGCLQPSTVNVLTKTGGRRDRRDEQDIEEVCLYPVLHFKTLYRYPRLPRDGFDFEEPEPDSEDYVIDDGSNSYLIAFLAWATRRRIAKRSHR